ncbi:MAG TPA: hypothetical protein VMU63_08945 [Acidimicrobiales bacterium]|nr:hypothetical protein [Acidimicrobiales bacterium]
MNQPAGGVGPAEVEAMVRRYLARVAVRSIPVLAVLLAALLVILLVPTHPSPPAATSVGSGSGSSAGGAGTSAGAQSNASGSGAAGSQSAASTGSSSGAGGTAAGGSVAAGSSGTSGGLSGNGGTGSTAGAGDVSRTGVRCGSGVRQFSYSRYAPMCVPAFGGNNGGATNAGVTGSTITIVYRNRSSGESAAISAATGAAEGGTDAQYLQDMQTYVGYFNKIFELYGRHVVLKAFNGQGDYVQEDQGQDLAAAEADAVTAKDLGAFADVSFPLGSSTQPYEEDLARQGVLSMGATYMPQSWFQQFAPYEYSAASPTGTQAGEHTIHLVCTRMAGLPAIFSGETVMQNTKRVFGLITPENPIYVQTGNQVQAGLSACGVKIARRATYAVDIPTYQQESTSIVAGMKAAGVSTILCGCDPLFPIFAANAADAEQYYPEWAGLGFGDPLARLPSSDQMAHAISTDGTQPAADATEAYTAFQKADPGGKPAEIYFPLPYEILLYLFDALQGAGPDLNPSSFQRAVFSMPASLPNGDFGPWQSGVNKYAPFTATQVGWWNPNAISKYDNMKGAWQSCEGGQYFAFDNPDAFAPAGRQLHCFNK